MATLWVLWLWGYADGLVSGDHRPDPYCVELSLKRGRGKEDLIFCRGEGTARSLRRIIAAVPRVSSCCSFSRSDIRYIVTMYSRLRDKTMYSLLSIADSSA